MKLCLLLGGPSAEREVSLMSGIGMARALANRGHDITLLDPATGRAMRIEDFHADPPKTEHPNIAELGQYSLGDMVLRSLTSDAILKADIVVFGLHGVPGEDGLMQSVLELQGKQYTGSDSRTSAICIDKHFTKIILKDAGISVPKGFIVQRNVHPSDRHAAWELAKAELGMPLVIKPNDQGSTVGLTILQDASEDNFNHAIDLALEYSAKALIEEFIDGRELTVGILDREALPIVEITTEGGFYDYHHKYTPGMSFHACPADLPSEIASGIQADALRAFEVIGCRGYARIDFRLRPDGTYSCLEINTLPGMTSTSLLPDAAQAAGISFEDLCERIVRTAIRE
ncbi:MAG: D-alanine--D-alanine ligase [Bacteroidota bacterium]|nr:D-alanine--D-alanine ligase [Bacteroidota bacterium]MDP4232336.1 D-alanine--D-alanine ligase [Bacteroidota bacterium]MDP4241475.1 D-alanine--D-alanine ligase [Bacteroidota bacterium]MDP4286701.1 D-alanine--D-alanine ligase [Bacteroidota bacterium]